MADFTSSFWSWFIIVPVVAGIAGMFILNIWMTGPKEEAGQKPKTMGHVWDEDLEEYNNPLPRWWLNMFYLTLVFGIVYLVLYPGLGTFAGAFGWTQKQQYDQEVTAANARFGPLYEKYLQEDLKQLARDPKAMKTGERLFVTYCTTCHGSDGGGATGFPSLRDNDWLYGGEPETIKASIMNGRAGMMPGWGAVLGQEGVFNVSEYILSLSGRLANESAAVAGREKYVRLCVACHGADAHGNQQLGAPNLADRIWLYGGSQKAVMQSISAGRQGRMPAHAEFLGEAKVHLLAAYVYHLSSESSARATEKQ